MKQSHIESALHEVIKPYSIYFQSEVFSIDSVHNFLMREYTVGSSFLNEEGLSFQETLDYYIKNTELNLIPKIIDTLGAIEKASNQQALLLHILSQLNYLYNILLISETEIKTIISHFERSRDLIVNTFSDILNLDNSDFKNGIQRQKLSDYFRGTNKLKFELSKIELATLLILLEEKGILQFPSQNVDIDRFLSNNCIYRNPKNDKYEEYTSDKPLISKIKRDDPGINTEEVRKNVLNKLLK